MSWVQQVHNAAIVARSLGCQCDTEIGCQQEGLRVSLKRESALAKPIAEPGPASRSNK